MDTTDESKLTDSDDRQLAAELENHRIPANEKSAAKDEHGRHGCWCWCSADCGDENGANGCCCPCIPKRYVTIFLLSLGMLVVHAMRVNLAVTVVVILDNTVLPSLLSEVTEVGQRVPDDPTLASCRPAVGLISAFNCYLIPPCHLYRAVAPPWSSW
ncbi:hypothetical protein LSH36_193g01036 [Paralvinella palmiformis]|uniref:Uncharacterized protein n=1 Tax=Paralvinella palmiformis TaxID=53620 RepID=A0AAD9JRK1_9ANNE|nr:hypothetical protein LSH36_193g01036 [Paralvinella palmiformis]